MKSTIMSVGKCLAGSLLLGAAILSVAKPARAFFGQSHAYSGCLNDYDGTNAYLAGANNLTANTLALACPVTDSSAMPRGSLNRLDVYYDDETTGGSVQAFRCVDYGSAVGGACGDSVSSSSSGTGVGVLHVPNTPASFAAAWNGSGFGWVEVFLPPKTAGGAVSRMKGMYEQVP